jgi:hypothetical protein
MRASVMGVRFRSLPDPVPHVVSAIAWREDAVIDVIAPLVEVAEREASAYASPDVDSLVDVRC